MTQKTTKTTRITDCPDCGRAFSIFRWRRLCIACEEVRCRSCLIESRLPAWATTFPRGSMCRPCHDKHSAPLEKRYLAAKESRVEVFAYFGRYEGEPAADPGSKLPIESSFHAEKDDAVKELQTIAAFHGRDTIEELQLSEESVRETTARPGEGPVPFAENRRSLWKASGVAISRVELPFQ